MRRINFYSIVLLVLLLGLRLLASESIESADFSLMEHRAHQLASRYGRGNVLLVYDIDNTLLTANQDLGSDMWFNWQSNQIRDSNSSYRVARTFPELLDIQTKLFSLGKMHLVDSTAAVIFNSLEKEGFETLILSSRGPNNRDATFRELAANEIDTSINPLGKHGVAGNFLPYDMNHPELSGLSRGELIKMALSQAREVSLVEGVYLTSGQDKGAMLRTLLWKLHRNFRAILFIDDTVKNVVKMQQAYETQDVDLVTIRYSKMDSEVKRFELGEKSKVNNAWRTIKSALEIVFR